MPSPDLLSCELSRPDGCRFESTGLAEADLEPADSRLRCLIGRPRRKRTIARLSIGNAGTIEEVTERIMVRTIGKMSRGGNKKKEER